MLENDKALRSIRLILSKEKQVMLTLSTEPNSKKLLFANLSYFAMGSTDDLIPLVWYCIFPLACGSLNLTLIDLWKTPMENTCTFANGNFLIMLIKLKRKNSSKKLKVQLSILLINLSWNHSWLFTTADIIKCK